MKKLLLILLMIVFSSINLCYSQDNQDNEDYQIYESNEEIEYITDEIVMQQVQRFGSGLPENEITRSRISTDEEFIFKTYIMEKLLKSNRILY